MYLGMANPPVGSHGCAARRRGTPDGDPSSAARPPGPAPRPYGEAGDLTVARTAGPGVRAQHGSQAPGHGFPARMPFYPAGGQAMAVALSSASTDSPRDRSSPPRNTSVRAH